MNSFAQLTARTNLRKEPMNTWPPRAGTRYCCKPEDRHQRRAGSGRKRAPRRCSRKLRVMLEEEPFMVEFFQAVRLLQRMEQDRERGRVFCDAGQRSGAVYGAASLSFPPSQLYSLERRKDGQLRAGGAVHGGLRGSYGDAACLYGVPADLVEGQGHRDGGLLRSVQPPYDLVFLSRVGEVPVVRGIRGRTRGQPVAADA